MSLSVTSNIIAARKNKGITQKEIAKRLGVSQAYYSKLEKRDLDLSINQIQSIADKLEIPISVLISISIKGSQSITIQTQLVNKDYIKKIEQDSILDNQEKLQNNREEALFNLLLERVFFNLLMNIESKISFDGSAAIVKKLINDDPEYIEKLLFEEFVEFGYPTVLTPKQVLMLVHEFVVMNQISFSKYNDGNDNSMLAYKFRIGKSPEAKRND